MNTVKILFVCMGNICRSPTAHGVLRHLVQQAGLEQIVEIDSAGTHAYHVSEPPDSRSQAAAKSRGIDISDLRARIVNTEDFAYYDYILGMDQENIQHLRTMCPPELAGKISLFLDSAPQLGRREVPDPYYGGPRGFDTVFDLVEVAAKKLLEDLSARRGI